MGEGDYCPDCGVSDPEDGCPECGRPCENKFHGEHADGAEVERLREALNAIADRKQHDDSYPEPTFHQVQGIARAAVHPDEKEDER